MSLLPGRLRHVGFDVLLVVIAFAIDGLGGVVGFDLEHGPLVLACVVVASGLLLVRRRLSWLPFVAWVAVGLIAGPVRGFEPAAGLLIALTTVASRERARVSVPAAVLALAPFLLNARDVYRLQRSTYPESLVPLLVFFWVTLAGAAWGLGRMIRLLRDREALQARIHATELGSVIRDERLRLARDLHDIVAHSVSAMILQAAGARSLSTETDIRIRTALRSVELTGADAMKELHRLLGLLRESSTAESPDLTAQPGLEDIDQILVTTRACGVEVELVETGTPHKLDAEVDYTAFRMVQECMANVIKHGGAGARSSVEIGWRADGLDITVRNDEHDAVSAAMLSGGYGLRGLTERVAEVGGRFAAGPAEESIFVASMSLPFRLAAAPSAGG